MSDINCNACNDLRKTSPEFVLNGVTEEICASLQNNTGFNPALTVPHDNCEDLNNALDCLIARMDAEIASYEVCDWKEFMHKFLPNLYEVNKAMICGDCGQWKNLSLLEARISDLCSIVQQVLVPPSEPYGVLTGSRFVDDTERMGGEIMQKDGQPIVVKEGEPLSNGEWNRCGIYYLRRQFYDCSGSIKTYEWIQPALFDYRFSSNAAYDDVVWRISVTEAQEKWGLTDAIIQWLHDYPQWWDGYGNSFGQRRECSLMLAVSDDGYLLVKVIGSLGEVAGMLVNGDTLTPSVIIS